MEVEMSNADQSVATINGTRGISSKRPLGLNGICHRVIFALAFTFTAALVLGLVP
jgi:hypothetical protein